MKNLRRLKIHNIKKSRNLPSNLWPWLFLLAVAVVLLSTPPMRERRAEYRIRRQFEQALAAFDGEETEFTITYETSCGRVAFYQRSSDQLTPKQRQAVEDYVHTLRYERPFHLDEEGNAMGGPIGGVSLSVHYSLPTGGMIQAGSYCWLEKEDGKRLKRIFYAPYAYSQPIIYIFTTQYRKELLNSAELST